MFACTSHSPGSLAAAVIIPLFRYPGNLCPLIIRDYIAEIRAFSSSRDTAPRYRDVLSHPPLSRLDSPRFSDNLYHFRPSTIARRSPLVIFYPSSLSAIARWITCLDRSHSSAAWPTRCTSEDARRTEGSPASRLPPGWEATPGVGVGSLARPRRRPWRRPRQRPRRWRRNWRVSSFASFSEKCFERSYRKSIRISEEL